MRGAGGHRGNTRGTTQLSPDGIGHRAACGAPVLALRRLSMADFAGYDPNTRLASAATDGGEGSGWSISLTGGLAALSDPFDGAYWIAPVRGLFGTKVWTADHNWTLTLQFIERSSTGTGTDYNIAIGVCNEATDSGTIDALAMGCRYATNRNIWQGSIANGTSTAAVQSISTMRGAVTTMTRNGVGTARVSQGSSVAVDANGASLSANTGLTALSVGWGDAEPYICVMAWRTATTAGTATGAYDFYAGLGTTWRASL